MTFPDTIDTDEQLDDVMSAPSDVLIEFIASLRGPLMVMGASGKMGPSLCVLARRAAERSGIDLPVIAAARFSDERARRWLEAGGVTTLQCDVMERDQVMALPDAANVIYMVGRKFGTADNPALTWAANTIPPVYVTERFRSARLVALSTGCVYPLSPVSRGGSVESDVLTPVGEYANACVARERMFQYCSGRFGTRICQVRLNYALDLRYGVFVDVARKVWLGQPVDVTMGYANCIWQRDANDMILRSLDFAKSPPHPINVTGRDVISIRQLATRFGELMGRDVRIVGEESSEALLSNSGEACRLLGPPETPLENVTRWAAHWTIAGGQVLGKATQFEVRDGNF